MSSKEEIVKQIIKPLQPTYNLTIADCSAIVFPAMDKWSKQECKSFASFVLNNFWQDLSNDKMDEWVSDTWSTEMKTYTFEEVYTLYLQQKDKP